MHRREFLGVVAASSMLGRIARAESLPSNLTITRIISFELHTWRSKLAGKLLNKPAYKLWDAANSGKVPICDGSIYSVGN